MTMRRQNVLCLSLALAAILGAQTQTEAPSFPNPRLMAIGGLHCAEAEDTSVLFANPAALAALKGGFQLGGLSLHGSGPLFDIANMLVDFDEANLLGSISGLLDERQRLYTSLDVGGPLSFAYAGNGLGFGFYNRSYAKVNVASLLSAQITLREDIELLGGYAYRFTFPAKIAMGLDLGVSPKGFIRGEIPLDTDILGVLGFIQDASSILDTSAFSMTYGIGLDAGLRYWVGKRFSLGLVAHDVYSPTVTMSYSSFNAYRVNPQTAAVGDPSYGIVPCSLAVGLYYSPNLGVVERYISSLKFTLDYQNLLIFLDSYHVNPILPLSAGLELTLHDIFHLRGGLSEGLLAAGFGLDLTLFSLDVAMCGKELGNEPGDRPVYNLLVGLSFNL